MSWKVYHKNGEPLADANGKEIEIHSLTYDGEWMGECAVTTDIENEAPIEFEIGDWIEYRGERFELNYDPGKVKQGRRNAVGNAFKYDSVKWNALSEELVRSDFLDVVLGGDNQLHYTALPIFSFYIETLDDLLDRLQACMDEQVGEGEWKFYSRNWARSRQRGCDKSRWEEIYGGKILEDGTSQEGVEDTKIDSTSINIQDQTIWEGLSLVNSKWDVNFVTRNREVAIDTAGLPTSNIFKYGKGNGLYEISQESDSDQKIVTRMRAYGSDKNLPTRYYATLNMTVWAAVSDIVLTNTNETIASFAVDLAGNRISAYFHTVVEGSPGVYQVKMRAGDTKVSGTVTGKVAGVVVEFSVVKVKSGDSQTAEQIKAFVEAIKSEKKVFFESGVNKYNFPSDKKDYTTENLPNNMACERLMLPGFPNESLADWWKRQTAKKKSELNPTGASLRFSERKDRPWIESAEADTLGVKSGSVYFDTEDVKNKIDEIYPTIKEATVDGVRVDTIWKGTDVDDNGVFRDGQTIPGCTIELQPEIDFDINDLKDDNFSVVMQTGMCAGRTFKVGGSVKKDGHWVLTLQRVEDGGIYYPYKDFQINKGDEFVLTGIDMPDEYVEWASEKLLRYAIAWLIKNDHTRYSYSPKVDEIFMARQHDEAMADKSGAQKSLHDTLKEGDLMLFEDADLKIASTGVIISKLTINEKEGNIPTYDITLRDDKEVGTIQRMQEQITALEVKATSAQTQGLATKPYLSKQNTDTAQGLITFLRGLRAEELSVFQMGVQFGDSFASGLTGFGGKIDGKGVGELEALTLRRWLEVPELRFNRVSVIVGNQWRAPGGGIIESVVPDMAEDGTELQKGVAYLKLEDGEIGKIAEDDICMGVWHDNITANNSDDDYDDSRGNFRFSGFFTAYFRIVEVMSVDGGMNNAFRYVLRNDDNFPNPKHPKAMMHFVSYGNFTDTTRQESRYSTLTYERYLQGVNTWEFSERNIGAQFGDLSNLSVFGLQMSGYSAYLNNVYMSGTIKQFDAIPYRMEVSNDLDGFLAWGESCTLTFTVMKGWDDVTDKVTAWKIERNTGDAASDTAWRQKQKVKDFAGCIVVSHKEAENDLGSELSTLFVVTATIGSQTTMATVEI